MRQFRKDIDWDKVDKLAEAGCSGLEVAAAIGIDSDTFYRRCVQEKGQTWANYGTERKYKGDTLLKVKQFQQALKGNTTMLIWLGKNRLAQSEKVESVTELPQTIQIEFINPNPNNGESNGVQEKKETDSTSQEL